MFKVMSLVSVMRGVLLFIGLCYLAVGMTARGSSLQCPLWCTCLDKASVVRCRHLPRDNIPPDIPTTTVHLDLDHNHLTAIRDPDLGNVSLIEVLSARDNLIRRLDPRSLARLTELRVLLLGNNLLSSLPENLFANNKHMEILDLSQNSLAVIPDWVLPPVASLQLLNLSYNQLQSANLGQGFRHVDRLRILDLSGNEFPFLEGADFRVVNSWIRGVPHAINLSDCNIQQVEKDAMVSLLLLDSLSLTGNPGISSTVFNISLRDLSKSNLRQLSLSALNLSDPYELFRNFQHSGLRVLALSRNEIRTIRRGTFYHLVGITILDLSHNRLRSLLGLSSLTELRSLDLSYNELTVLDPLSLESFQNLDHLDLSHNSLVEIDDAPFRNLFYLRHLDISNNAISSIRISSGLESLNTLLVRDNLISDLSFVSHLRQLRHLDASHNHITRLDQWLLAKGQHLLEVNLSHNAIWRLDSVAFGDQTVIDLSYNRLSSLSHAGWTRTRVLILAHNSLYNLSANTFLDLDSLEDLDLSHNQLVAFSRSTFSPLSSTLRRLVLAHNPLGVFLALDQAPTVVGLSALRRLDLLDLSHTELNQFPDSFLVSLTSLRRLHLESNRLRSLNSESLVRLRRLETLNLANNLIANVDPSGLRRLRHLRFVDLSRNAFHCSCELLTFRSWAVSTLGSEHHSDEGRPPGVQLIGLASYECAAPPEWRSVPLLDFQLDSTSCSATEQTLVMVMVTFCSGVLLLLVVALSAAMKYGRWRRQAADTHTTVPAVRETFVDDSSTAALTGNQTLTNANTIRDWV